jgi:Uma2 family endonuclease
MTTEAKLLTAEEFMLLPEPLEGGKMELVRGEVVTMAPVGGEHGSVASELVGKLRLFCREHDLGQAAVEVGYRLQREPDLVRAPDVSFLEAARLEEGRFPRSFVDGPPTLAVEVVSPGDRDVDLSTKVEEYLAAGARRVWLVRPGLRTITVHRPNGDAHTYRAGDTLSSDDAGFDVEGFALRVDEVFA